MPPSTSPPFVHPLRRLSRRALARTSDGLSTDEFVHSILDEILLLYQGQRAVLWTVEGGQSLRHVLERDPPRFLVEPVSREPSKDEEQGLEGVDPVVVVHFDGVEVGALELQGLEVGRFGTDDRKVLSEVAPIFLLALKGQKAQAALRERVKELTCLHGLTSLSTRSELTNEELLTAAVRLLPPAWQYPEVACARIVVNGGCYETPGFRPGPQVQEAPIAVGGVPRGRVMVAYTRQMNEGHEAFLDWEGSLIQAVARQLGLMLEHRQGEKERSRLHEQLRHADRLATIGQLAAGVAHELNEPLANALGFAQLALKAPVLPPAVEGDLRKIEAATLHAREVIRKLMYFGRQLPLREELVSLNWVIEEGMYFLASRCEKAGVLVTLELEPSLPSVLADASRLNQVLVNLVVNAVQAMASGGELTVRTRSTEKQVVLEVEDNGVGMTESVAGQIFLPFFTTKDVDQGTGLGLPVAHGIVTASNGTIEVDTRPGEGSRFVVLLPRPSSSSAKGSHRG